MGQSQIVTIAQVFIFKCHFPCRRRSHCAKLSNLCPECEAQGSWIEVEKHSAVTHTTNLENEVSKMFIISLGNLLELETTPWSQAVRALEYGPLNQPISNHARSTWYK